eukprot:m.153663 g.153663  ORF g.153663 m.153663 type:complete len:347 (+) comp16372_c0_seq1:119-1159(+)
MGKDYYKILGLSRDCAEEDIKKAYKKNAMKFHPDRNKAADAKEKFQEISEAYEVLSDKNKRAVFDQYGEEGLKGGGPAGPSGFSGGGGAHGFSPRAAEDIFASFFGGQDPFGGAGGFGSIFGGGAGGPGGGMFGGGGGNPFGGMSGGGFGQPQGRAPRASSTAGMKAEVVTQPVRVTLEDLFNGFHKKLKVTKKVYDATGRMTSSAKVHEIQGKAGWKAGTKVTFKGAGDELPGKPAQDIQFVIEEKPHAVFKREGDDLHMNLKMDVIDAWCGFSTTVKGIDGRTVPVSCSQAPTANELRIPSHGMPKKAGGRGALVVHFQVKYPALSPEQKQQLKQQFGSGMLAK